MQPKVITPKALSELKSFDWTGNIRELRNIIERLVILTNDKITDEDVRKFSSVSQSNTTPTDLFNQFDRFHDFKEHIEKMFIKHKLEQNSWNVSKTAEQLDIQRSHLYNKIEKFNLKRS
jgi:DNA-binding NtrC family response regulator